MECKLFNLAQAVDSPLNTKDVSMMHLIDHGYIDDVLALKDIDDKDESSISPCQSELSCTIINYYLSDNYEEDSEYMLNLNSILKCNDRIQNNISKIIDLQNQIALLENENILMQWSIDRGYENLDKIKI